MVLLLALLYLLIHGQMDLLCAVVAFFVLFVITSVNRTAGVLCTMSYLILLGDLRRLVVVYFGQSKLDLLLVVGPVLAFYFALPSLLSLRLRDPLSKAFFIVFVVMVLQIFNPQQGGLVVGASGAVFYIAPALWFWVGREYASPEVLRLFLYRFLLPLAVAAAVLGLVQTFVGFLPFERIWVDHYAYSSLHVGGTIRAFGFSVSPAEYAGLLAIGSAVVIAAAFAGLRGALLLLPLLVSGLFLASSRSLLLKLLLAGSVAFILRHGRKVGPATLLKLGGVLTVGLLGLYLGARHLSSDSSGDKAANTGVQALVSHQTGGFAHPLDSKYSTAAWHGTLVLSGIIEGFKDPLGHGLGSTTLAGGKFNSEAATEATEVDFSDMFICLGLLGGVAYLYVAFAALRQGLVYLKQTPLQIALPLLACLSVTLASWLRTGEYSTNAMACFFLGSLTYSHAGGYREIRTLPGNSRQGS